MKILKRSMLLLLCLFLFPTEVYASNIREWNYGYVGKIEEFITPQNGLYKIEVWGAQGGSTEKLDGGQGGYYSIEVVLEKDEKIYIGVGGMGKKKGTGGYNGGGTSSVGSSGGGATHVAYENRGTLNKYEKYKDELLVVAGGGGGACTSETEYKNVYVIDKYTGVGSYKDVMFYTLPGSGGGNVGSDTFTAVNLKELVEEYIYKGGSQDTGYKFGLGQNGATGGGGGFYGGFGETKTSNKFTSAAGGSGYCNPKFLESADVATGVNEGDGKCKITYLGTPEVDIKLHLNGIGTYDGKSDSVLTLKFQLGKEVFLNDIETYSNYEFKYYIDRRTKEKIENGFILKDKYLEIEPFFKSNLNINIIDITSVYKNYNSIRIEMSQNDTYSKYYKIYQSKDKLSWYDAFLALDNINPIPTRNFELNKGKYEYIVPIIGEYQIELYGAQGGNSTNINGVITQGGKGGYTKGTVYLEKYDKMYIKIGEQGENGENLDPGVGSWSVSKGDGGKSSDIRINSNTVYDRIMVAAGGGGSASYGSLRGEGGYGGGLTGGNSRHLQYAPDAGKYDVANSTGGSQTSGGLQEFGEYISYGKINKTRTYGGFGNKPSKYDMGWAGGEGWYNGGHSQTTSNVFSGAGGSSYISGHKGCKDYPDKIPTHTFTNTELKGNQRTGNGYGKFIVLGDTIVRESFVNDINIIDLAAPNLPSNGKINSENNKLKLSWKDNGDNGTKYYHKVESYDSQTDELLSTSDIIEHMAISGVKGYHYYIDNNPVGIVTVNHDFVEKPQILIDKPTKNTYAHIAAIDNAGNISGTYNIEISLYLTINYNGNNIAVNQYGDVVTSITSGYINSQILEETNTVTIKENKTKDNDVAYLKKGYIFQYWNTKSNNTGNIFKENMSISYQNLINTYGYNINLYAIWEPIKYIVNLHKNRPIDASNEIIYHGNNSWDNKFTYYSNEFRYDNANVKLQGTNIYSLKGWTIDSYWYEKQDGNNGGATGKTYIENQMNLTTVDKDVINLYPKWIKNKYTIIYNGNDTVNNIYGNKVTSKFTGSTPNTTCLYDTDVTLARNGFSKIGYEFKGWNTKSDGSGKYYKSGETLVKPNFTDKNNGQITLYAIWEPVSYMVNLYKNRPVDASNEIKYSGDNTWIKNHDCYSRSFKYDDNSNLPSTSIYKLKGWKITENWYESKKGNNGGVSGTSYSSGLVNLTDRNGKVINLYVGWEKIKYTIVYEANDSEVTGSTPNTACLYDTDITLARNGFDKNGYYFKGWNTKSDGSGVYYKSEEKLTKPNFTDVDNGKVVLYAIWEPIKYTIRFNGNGNWNINQGSYEIEVQYNDACLLENKFTRRTQMSDPFTGKIYNIEYRFLGWSFNANGVGYAETYKGVRCDATNILNPLVCNFTNVNGAIVDLYAMWERIPPNEYSIEYDWVNEDPIIEIEDPDSSENNDGILEMILWRSNKDFPKIIEEVEGLVRKRANPNLYGNDTCIIKKDLSNGSSDRKISYKEYREGINYYILEIIDRAGGVTFFEIIVKIDKTAPGLPQEEQLFNIKQVDLNEVDSDKMESFIMDENKVKCLFEFNFKEQNLTGHYAYGSPSNVIDSSGFYKILLTLSNVEDPNDKAVYTLYDYENRDVGVSSLSYNFDLKRYGEVNTNETNISMFRDKMNFDAYAQMHLESKINTFNDFPKASALNYEIELIDRAGNSTKYWNIDGNEIRNFSIKAVINSAEGDGFNDLVFYQAENVNKESLINVPYFELGDTGYIEAWTIGYVKDIQLDFGNGEKSIGMEMVEEIKNNKVPKKYNLGVFESDALLDYVRKISFDRGKKINVSYALDVDGIPFATYYGGIEKGLDVQNKWLSEGTSIRIPLYYQLIKKEDVNSKKTDGRDSYESELHTANVYGWKNGFKTTSQAPYIIYDTRSDNLHYRVTHEATSLGR